MGRKVAYMMSRFPKVTETFILYEILELKKLGLDIEIYPLLKQKEAVTHPEVDTLKGQIHYHSLLSMEVLMAQLFWLMKSPAKYLSLWGQVIKGNAESLKFLIRALVVVPMAALFAKKMKERGISHIHAHWATHPTLAAFIIEQLAGIPYSFTAHAHDIYVEQAMLSEKLEQAKFAVTISEFNRQFMTPYANNCAEKIQVIHCGIDPDVFQPRQVAHERFTITCIASLEEKKGHKYLIEACVRLMDTDFQCLLIGDGDLRPELEAQIAKLGLQDRVKLLGRQPRHKVSEILAQSDVMVLPSIITNTGKKEGIPVALMEALAMELPVVATNISGVPELVEHEKTGLLVAERDPAALANAILEVYHNRERARRLARAGREKVLNEFNLRRSAEQMYRLLADEQTVVEKAERVLAQVP